MILKYWQRLLLPCDHVIKIVYDQLMSAKINGSSPSSKYVKDFY